MAEVLIELLSEEIPARMQKNAAEHLEKAMLAALNEAGLTVGSSASYYTPRRLALVIKDVPDRTPDVREERRGPRVGAPEQALQGFCRGAGITVDDLEVRAEKKGEFYFAVIEKAGQPTADILSSQLPTIIKNFSWPKSQRWGEGDLRWVRPLHSMICLFGGELVDVQLDGVRCGNTTSGHRFMAPKTFSVIDFAEYKKKLETAKVLLSAADRMLAIQHGAERLAAEKGLELIVDEGLLAEVAGLVEWPVPLIGSFDPEFLSVPEEVLILTMRKDQKYFVLRDPKTGKLAPNFITVSNLIASDGGAVVAAGNEKVIAARLADARFFWDQDRKTKDGGKILDDLLPNLTDIVFHKQLGSVADRVGRITALAGYLAKACRAERKEAERAAALCKADLTSHMVYEFPEVQGVMGRYYALEQGESEEVADAIRDHYAPAGPSDACPSAPVSVAVALAEKIDTLVGFFGINQQPTGSKDPFALRRAALGVIRLITENGLRISLIDLIQISAELHQNSAIAALKNMFDVISDQNKSKRLISAAIKAAPANVSGKLQIGEAQSQTSASFIQDSGLNAILPFFADRLKVQQKAEGVRHDLIDAVFALDGADDWVLLLARVHALQAFVKTEDGANLLAGYKRAANILAKAEQDTFAIPSDKLLSEAADQTLYQAISHTKAAVKMALAEENFTNAMTELAKLRGPIDGFFDSVMVNADDAALRENRLAMLSAFKNAVDQVADFSQIEG